MNSLKNSTEFNDSDLIFIPFNVPSLKNSKVKTSRGIFSSKTVKKYLTLLGIQTYSTSKKEVKGYVRKENMFKSICERIVEQKKGKDQPFLIGYHFIRDSKRDFDFNNATQIIQDLLIAHDFFEDDCMRVMIPVPMMMNGQWYSVDKLSAGVYIKIL